jgi:hypothetical protein
MGNKARQIESAKHIKADIPVECKFARQPCGQSRFECMHQKYDERPQGRSRSIDGQLAFARDAAKERGRSTT